MTIYKDPYEQFGVALDFSADMGQGNGIASITAVKAVNNLTGANSTAEVIASSPAPSISGTSVSLTVTGGVAGEIHTISVQIISSIGEQYQGDLTLRVVSDSGASVIPGTGYCQISDVVAEYSSFERNQTGSVSDTQIQAWINRGTSLINAAFFQKGIDLTQPKLPNDQAISADQMNWLIDLNEDYAASKLGAVLQSNVTLQPGEVSIAGQRRKRFETELANIGKGKYDAWFGIPSTIAESWGGGETDRSTPAARGENKFFGKNEDF
jgi:hypothetical protein